MKILRVADSICNEVDQLTQAHYADSLGFDSRVGQIVHSFATASHRCQFFEHVLLGGRNGPCHSLQASAEFREYFFLYLVAYFSFYHEKAINALYELA